MLLTGKQLEVLRFLRDFRRANCIAPTLEEVAQAFGISKITVHEHLSHLARKGAIRRARAKARGIQVLYDPDSPAGRGLTPGGVTLPILGTVAAGRPIEAIEDRESIDLAELVPHGPDHYLLRVRGDSMIEDHIQDGDYVVIEKRASAHNGETVVAVLDDNEATLKRFYKDDAGIRLQPANANYLPVVRDSVEIRGVVVGVVRRVG